MLFISFYFLSKCSYTISQAGDEFRSGATGLGAPHQWRSQDGADPALSPGLVGRGIFCREKCVMPLLFEPSLEVSTIALKLAGPP